MEEPAQNKYGTAATDRLIGQFGLNLVCKIIVVSGNCSFILCSYLQYFWPYRQKFFFTWRLPTRNCNISLTFRFINLQFCMLIHWGGMDNHIYFQVPTCQNFDHMDKKSFLHLFIGYIDRDNHNIRNSTFKKITQKRSIITNAEFIIKKLSSS